MTSFETAVAADFTGALNFVEKAAPAVEGAVVSDFNNAVAALKAAFIPVGDALVVAIVSDITAKYGLNAPLSISEIATLEGVVAKLQALIPTT